MSEPKTNHPDRGVLVDFGLGRLDSTQSSSIEQHLSVCQECSDTLLTLQDSTPSESSVAEHPRREDGDVDKSPTPDEDQSNGVATREEEPNQAPTILVQSREMREPSELPPELQDHPRYRIVEQIGQGGMGDVYRAEHKLMNRSVALKVINSQLVNHPQAVERFRREVQAAAQLTHPNIVTAFDAEQAGDVHFLVMEFVEGTDLASVVQHRGPLSVEEACDWIGQAAMGLQHAHEKGMVHRDIKPHNLMLSPDGQIRILDFGLAGFATESAVLEADRTAGTEGDTSPQHLTTLGSVMGTPDYIAPEQARDAHTADVRADIYSLGCTLFFLLKGDAPFAADAVIDKLRAHAEQEPPDLSSVRDDVPVALSEIIGWMMAKDPDDRFSEPRLVVEALLPFASLDTPSTDRRESARGQTDIEHDESRPRGRRNALLVALTVLLLGAVTVIATSRGRVELRTEVGDVKVVVRQDGETVATIDIKSASQVTWIPAGDVELELVGANKAVKLDRTSFAMTRLGTVVVTAQWSSEGSGAIRSFKTLDQPITRDGIEVADGGWKITSTETRTVNLFEVSNPRLDVGPFFYRAKLRTDAVNGRAFLELWTRLAGGGESYSRGFHNALTGTNGWAEYEIPFVLRNSEQADLVKLNVTIEGGGTVWIKDVELRGRSTMPSGQQRLQEIQLAESGRLVGHKDDINAIEFSLDGKSLFSGGGEKTLYQWDVASRKVVRRIPVGDYVRGIAVLPDGGHVISSQVGGSVTLWNLAEQRGVRQFSGHTKPVNAICVSPNGKQLLSGGNDGLVRLWDIETGEAIHSVTATYCNAVAMTRDGRLAVHGTANGGWSIWETNTHKVQPQVRRQARSLDCLAFSPDGKHLASGDGNGVIQVWEVATGREIHRFDAHQDRVASLVFTPDGRHFLSSSYDQTLLIFEMVRGLEVGHVATDTLCVTRLAISPNGQTVASGGGIHQELVDGVWTQRKDGDFDIRLWRLPESVWPKTGESDAHFARIKIVWKLDEREGAFFMIDSEVQFDSENTFPKDAETLMYKLKPGQHRLRFERKGYHPLTTADEYLPQETQTLELPWRPL